MANHSVSDTHPRLGRIGVPTSLRGLVTTGSVDVLLWLLATLGAFLVRFDGAIPAWSPVTIAIVTLTLFKLAAATTFRLYRQSWRRYSFPDARPLAYAMAASTVAGTLFVAVFPGSAIPLGLPAIDGLLSLLLMLGARGLVRYRWEAVPSQALGGRKVRSVLLIGAGRSGTLMARELIRHPETRMRPVAFLDDNRALNGQTIAGIPVVGTIDQLEDVIAKRHVEDVLICISSASGSLVRKVIERVRRVSPDIACRTMPALHEVLSGRVQINRIRNVTIDDLLKRPTVELDAQGVMDHLGGKRVMVTGAGGSIGSELVRQICEFEPAELILLGHGENSIYQLERELDVRWPNIRYSSVIAKIQNAVRLDHVFRTYRPDVVFHTAAHKHVPLMERNPEEAVFNNIVGSRNLVRTALKHGVTHFVNISTDKAVHPTSVMGATKRIVEMLVEAAAERAGSDQTFVSVRFGNVLGSRGSVVPIFKRQIAAGGPVTVTHPDMVRYFMTIPEAARLVLQASRQGHNGEVYILDMGEPVRILDLVTDLIHLSGLEPDVDVPIRFTGVRPGEKLYEELMTERENVSKTEHDKIFVAVPSAVDEQQLAETIQLLTDAAMQSDGARIRTILNERIDGARLKVPTKAATKVPKKVQAKSTGVSETPPLAG